jgi:hypothetical protein
MSDEKISLDLDPKKVIDSLNKVAEDSKNLARQIEDSLGKEAPKSVRKLEETCEKGTSRIATFFGTLGHRIKEDMKAAMDATGVLAGAKFAEEIGKGIKSIFTMEQAFSRLNTRLKMTVDEFSKFKIELGRKAAASGQKVEDILPGVETASSRGGVTSASQLTAIGDSLGKAKAITGEGTEQLSETVVDILKNQGKKVTSQSFKDTLDALEGARVNGSFKTAADAGHSVEDLSKLTGTKLSIREMSGLAAQSSIGGEGSSSIMKQILEKGQTSGGQQYLSQILGLKYNKGKLDTGSLKNINLDKYKGLNKEQFGQVTGFDGASGSDLVRFVESFKHGATQMKNVVGGSNETATQFGIATNNLKSKVDKYKESVTEAGAEVGQGLSELGDGILSGDMKKIKHGASEAGKAVKDNAGTLGSALGISSVVATVAGGGLRSLLKGKGVGMASGMAEGKMAEAAGITQVYVTNWAEINKDSAGAGIKDAVEKVSKFGGVAGGIAKGTSVLGVGATAFEAGQALAETESGKKASEYMSDKIFKLFGGQDQQGQQNQAIKEYSEGHTQEQTDRFIAALKGVKIENKIHGNLTNPSRVKGTGAPH